MKKFLVILLVVLTACAPIGRQVLAKPAQTYYIAPTGRDSNVGSITAPWKTIPKAASVVAAGDTVYLRGGVYNLTATVNLSTRGPNGTAGNLIKLWNYPGEIPILDFSGAVPGVRAFYFANKNYWDIKGLEIRNDKQSSAGEFFLTFDINNANNNIFENLSIHDNGGVGLAIEGNSDGNLILNSDFYQNSDTVTGGGNADGTGFGVGTGSNTYRGCRSWLNSDDGYDFYNWNGTVHLENDWSFWNGYTVQVDGSRVHSGDGNGFKLGMTTTTSTTPAYYLSNNLAFENWQAGFTQEDAKKAMVAYNNTAYKNVLSCGYGVGFRLNSFTGSQIYYNLPHILRNNISYENGSTCGDSNYNWQNPSIPRMKQDHNTWNMSFAVSDADFLSVDSTGVDGQRQVDGSLPVLPFLKLNRGSRLIDAGVNVGLPYSGNAPDLGTYEYQEVLITATPTIVPTVTP